MKEQYWFKGKVKKMSKNWGFYEKACLGKSFIDISFFLSSLKIIRTSKVIILKKLGKGETLKNFSYNRLSPEILNPHLNSYNKVLVF